MNRGRWTERELAILREQYPTELAEDVAAAIGRPVAGVKSKAQSLGIRKANRVEWTDEMLAVLCNKYPDENAQDVADELGLPIGTVYAKANAIGLRKSREFLESEKSGRLTAENSVERSGYEHWTSEEDRIMCDRYPP